MKQTTIVVICLLLFFGLFTNPTHVFASLTINEFSSDSSPDWIEFYNSGATSEDLSLYQLQDASGNILGLSGTLQGNSFFTFDWSNRLDNGGDTIQLIKISDSSLLEQIIYGSEDESIISAPPKGLSAGRTRDGESQWTLFQTPTKNSSNNTALIYALPTSTPTKTPTPTHTPTPTRTPTPTKIPTPTRVPTLSRSLQGGERVPTFGQEGISKKSVLSDTDSTDATDAAWENQPTVILAGLQGTDVKAPPSPSGATVKVKGERNFPYAPAAALILALLFLCCAILFFLQKKRKEAAGL